MTKSAFPGFALLALAVLLTAPASAQTGEPSRPAIDGCAWEKLSDASVGLSAWVQRCDFGNRQIDLHFEGSNVVQKFSDGGDPTPVIQVFDLKDGESAESALRRIYDEHTDAAIAARCVPVPASLTIPRAGVERFSFVPDKTYLAELDAAAIPDDVPEPACGDLGDWPDGIQYFEVHPESAARKILFVTVGQDTPLFDEQTLELLVP
jgi:hypothetical protein